VIARLALTQVDQPEDGAAAVLFLCSEQANYMTGVTLPVDGGFLLYNAGSPSTSARHRQRRPPQGPRVAAAPVGVGQTLTEEPLDSPLAIG
jgi:hypothetical protein